MVYRYFGIVCCSLSVGVCLLSVAGLSQRGRDFQWLSLISCCFLPSLHLVMLLYSLPPYWSKPFITSVLLSFFYAHFLVFLPSFYIHLSTSLSSCLSQFLFYPSPFSSSLPPACKYINKDVHTVKLLLSFAPLCQLGLPAFKRRALSFNYGHFCECVPLIYIVWVLNYKLWVTAPPSLNILCFRYGET